MPRLEIEDGWDILLDRVLIHSNQTSIVDQKNITYQLCLLFTNRRHPPLLRPRPPRPPHHLANRRGHAPAPPLHHHDLIGLIGWPRPQERGDLQGGPPRQPLAVVPAVPRPRVSAERPPGGIPVRGDLGEREDHLQDGQGQRRWGQMLSSVFKKSSTKVWLACNMQTSKVKSFVLCLRIWFVTILGISAIIFCGQRPVGKVSFSWLRDEKFSRPALSRCFLLNQILDKYWLVIISFSDQLFDGRNWLFCEMFDSVGILPVILIFFQYR